MALKLQDPPAEKVLASKSGLGAAKSPTAVAPRGHKYRGIVKWRPPGLEVFGVTEHCSFAKHNLGHQPCE